MKDETTVEINMPPTPFRVNLTGRTAVGMALDILEGVTPADLDPVRDRLLALLGIDGKERERQEFLAVMRRIHEQDDED